MTKISVFNNEWFARMIEGQLGKCGDAGPEALAIARGIMVGCAFIAEAIDDATEAADKRAAESLSA